MGHQPVQRVFEIRHFKSIKRPFKDAVGRNQILEIAHDIKQTSSESMNPNKKRTILTIDDSKVFRKLIKMALEFEGFHLLEADDGQSGLDLALSANPDLILLDLMMPGMNGLQVCQALKSNPQLQSIPIVLLSASDDSDDIEACLQLGAQNYVMKPFRPKMLIDVVREQLPPNTSPALAH